MAAAELVPCEFPDIWRVETLGSVQDIPHSAWQDVAPSDDPLYDHAFFLAMERSGLGPDSCLYITLRHNGRIRAVLPVFVFGGLPLADVLGERGRRALRPVDRILGKPLRIRVLLCGHLLGAGRILRGVDLPDEAPQLLVNAVRKLSDALAARWIAFKDFPRDDLEWLSSALQGGGYFRAPGLPDAELILKEHTFEAFVASLPAKPRRNARYNIRKFDRSRDSRIEVRECFDDLVPEIMPLYRAVLQRAETRLDVWTPQFIRLLSTDPRIPARLVCCWKGGRLAGFLLCLIGKETAVAMRVGLDYDSSRALRLYHVMHYSGIEEAILSGAEKINLMQTSYEAKCEMGCRLVPLEHAVTHRNPIVRMILRSILPLVLNQSGKQS